MGIQRNSFYNWKHTLTHPAERTKALLSNLALFEESRRGDRMTYLSGLDDLIELKKQYPQYERVLHSDQGAVYASKAFNELLPMYGIAQSMSRVGTPTDNATMESINGWIKTKIFMDFHVTGESPVEQEVAAYITFFNPARPAYSLKYLTPQQYKEAYALRKFATGVSAGS